MHTRPNYFHRPSIVIIARALGVKVESVRARIIFLTLTDMEVDVIRLLEIERLPVANLVRVVATRAQIARIIAHL